MARDFINELAIMILRLIGLKDEFDSHQSTKPNFKSHELQNRINDWDDNIPNYWTNNGICDMVPLYVR